MPTLRATFRIQFRPDFDLSAAADVADYLAALGVSHLYASPYLQAAPGSTHGYDVVDPTRVSRDLGGEAGHQRLTRSLDRAGLGQVLDIVPNHMSVAEGNAWWWDVLRNGPASRHANVFDVDWDPPEAKLRNQVLMPILGDHYGRELEAGHLRLERVGAEFVLRYHDRAIPVGTASLPPLLERAATLLMEPPDPPADGRTLQFPGPATAPPTSGDGEDPASPDMTRAEELAFLARSLRRLPDAGAEDAGLREARRRDLDVVEGRLRDLTARPAVVRALDRAVRELNEDVEALDDLVSVQNYRLAYWRTAGQELDYRRFFDIDNLAAIRTEDPRVFEAVHDLPLRWVREGVLDGLRVDHPDGLRLPAEYFRRLREAAPGAWIVVEKILMPDEALRPWPVDGTTGYDFLNMVTGLFLEPSSGDAFTALWRTVSGDDRPFHDVALEARDQVLRDVLAADLNRLANVFVQVCEARRRYRDFTRSDLREALAAVAVTFPVYRAYVSESGAADEADREVVDRAVGAALARRPELDPELLGLLRDVLLGEAAGDAARGLRMRFQQLTGPVAAKGEEDTAFYRYLRFAALNEVGGDPGRWGLDPGEFHRRCRVMAENWPRTMTALSTHDGKRSEDVRARLLALSGLPGEWTRAVRGWRERNAGLWPAPVPPDPAMEYLLYQTLVGAWPISADRMVAYMEKASREAKLRTSWTDPVAAYDEALATFVRAVMENDAFIRDLEAFTRPLVEPGRVVSMAQKLVQLTAPGVPDVYQGTEVWDLSLVDPDNRRPVDWTRRRELLAWLDAGRSPDEILSRMDDGAPKMWVVRQALRLRAERPDAFVGATYTPLSFDGADGRAVGFLRGAEVAVVVPRRVLALHRRGGWGDAAVRLPPGRWRNALTSAHLEGADLDGAHLTGGDPGTALDAVFRDFPVALLVREHAP